jgi:hypothetical protein
MTCFKHYIKRCLNCQMVMEQCACEGTEKDVFWSICDQCLGMRREL